MPPVRKVRRRVHLVVGGVPDRELKRMVDYEGLNERACIYLLRHDPQVVKYEEQPCHIRYSYKGKNRYYTPDFLVTWRDGTHTLIECKSEFIKGKPESELDDPENRVKWSAAQLWCDQRHYTFVLVTKESLLQHKTLLANIQLLAGHAHQHLPLQVKEYLLKTIQVANRPLSFTECVQLCSSLHPDVVRSALCHLLYTGELTTDLSQPFHVKKTLIQLT